MKTLGRGALVWSLFLLLLPACGRQLVEFGAEGADKADAGHDAVVPVDAPRNDTGTPDVPGDVPRLDLAADLPRDLPGVDTPRVDAPGVDAPADVPGIDVPADVPGVDVPGIDAPRADAVDVGADLPGVDLPGVDMPRVDASADVNDARFDTFGVDLSGCGLPTVVLGTAASFAVLAGSTVTNTGMSTVTGDLGLSPGSSVTGFPPGMLVGTQHINDAIAVNAKLDLDAAYVSAAGRTLCATPIAPELGQLILTPGLYSSSSGGFVISAGPLVLDAQGNPNAVFIFQMTGTLTVAANLQIFTINGATSSMVFWQVGMSATLGTGSAFVGTIMAANSITLNTNATVDGRTLARSAAVTLDTNVVGVVP